MATILGAGMNDAAHVDTKVLLLTNENERFKSLQKGKKEKLQVPEDATLKNSTARNFVKKHGHKAFDHVAHDKLGSDFWSLRNADGTFNSLGMKTPYAEDTDGGTADGSGSQSRHTSLRWAGGDSLNADNINYFVLPQDASDKVVDGAVQLNGWGQHAKGPSGAGAFAGTDVKTGDVGMISTPGGGVTVGILGDRGPHAEIGEYSTSMLKDAGLVKANGRALTSSNLDDGSVQLSVFPGTRSELLDKNGQIAKIVDPKTGKERQMTPAELKKKMWEIVQRRLAAYSGGYVITRGANTVFIGKDQKQAGFADPICTNTSGAWHEFGSELVSIENRPMVRLGDFDSFRFQCVTGNAEIQVYGKPTNKNTTPYMQMPLSAMPAWSQSVMGSKPKVPQLGEDYQGVLDNPFFPEDRLPTFPSEPANPPAPQPSLLDSMGMGSQELGPLGQSLSLGLK